MAAPGEFTLRAFLNGRIDLTEAEAVGDIINAKTDEAAKAAVAQLHGRLHTEIAALRKDLVAALARLEMGIDFTEEDLDPAELASVKARFEGVRKRIAALQASYRRGRILRDGFVVVLAGPPNVGKSTLFNLLAQDDRAIVTEIPGTTRDILYEYINCDGWPVCIVDTAGIHEATDLVERIGVERSGQAIRSADAAVWMIDATGRWDSQKPPSSMSDLNVPWLICANKIDLCADSTETVRTIEKKQDGQRPVLPISAKNGTGIDELLHEFKRWIGTHEMADASAGIAINDRHRTALARADQALAAASTALESKTGGVIELAAFDANEATAALGEIIGATTTDDILGEIFANFCVGK